MTLPAIGALRERWPKAHLEILGYPHIIELAAGRHYADAVRSIEARALAGFFVPDGPLSPDWVDYFSRFQLVVSYLYDPDEIFAGNIRRCGVRQLITASPRPTDRHAAEHYCQPLESLAIFVTAPAPRVYPNAADRQSAAQFLAAHPPQTPLAAIHPGSGSPKKNWPVEKFTTVAHWLATEQGMRLLIVQGEADDLAAGQLRAALAPGPLIVACGLKLVELAAVLERCALFVGNDSGITHLATAVGLPTVALYGPASLPIWTPRPWAAPARVVRFGTDDLREVQAALRTLVC